MTLEYPDAAPTSYINDATAKIEERIKSMTVVDMVNLVKADLQDKDWKEISIQ
jgi:hypothetical protein